MAFRKIAPGDSGYTPAKAYARRMYNPSTGEELSYRQYDKLRRGGLSYEQTTALKPPSQRPTGEGKSRYNAFKAAYATKHGITAGQAAKSAEFKALYAGHRKITRRKPENRPTQAGGEWSDILEDIGVREPDVDYAVGETP